jgi:Mn-dependent DtxR family transcriptional regulator
MSNLHTVELAGEAKDIKAKMEVANTSVTKMQKDLKESQTARDAM